MPQESSDRRFLQMTSAAAIFKTGGWLSLSLVFPANILHGVDGENDNPKLYFLKPKNIAHGFLLQWRGHELPADHLINHQRLHHDQT